MLILKPGAPSFIEFLFDETNDLISEIRSKRFSDINQSAINEAFLIYIYRLYEKQLKWVLRKHKLEDDYIKRILKKKEDYLLKVKDYLKFVRKISSTVAFKNQVAIKEIESEFRIIRNAIVHGEAPYRDSKIFEKLAAENKAYMTGDGFFHPSADYLLDILQKIKNIVLEVDEIISDIE